MDSSEEALSEGSRSDSEQRHSIEQSSEFETADEEIIFLDLFYQSVIDVIEWITPPT